MSHIPTLAGLVDGGLVGAGGVARVKEGVSQGLNPRVTPTPA
jgi:hypothetical protein